MNKSLKEGVFLHFLGANRQVTGSCYVLEVDGFRVIIDCGMFQERQFLDRNWRGCELDPQTLDCLLLTHAHLDHSGRIPKIVKHGFDGLIWSTPPSLELARLILEDSAHIQEEDAKYKRRRHKREGREDKGPIEPLYTSEDAEETFHLFRPIDFDSIKALNEHISVKFHDSGHILGSALLEVIINRKGSTCRVVFSGDVGPWQKALVRNPTVLSQADYVIIESTYGNRLHEGNDEARILDRLEAIIDDTVRRGGNLVIPTFAIDRAQGLMYYISKLVYNDRIPDMMVFLDSPMAIDATMTFKRFKHYLDASTNEMFEGRRHPFAFERLQLARSVEQSRAINSIRGTCIVMSASGMCTGGRIKHHLRHNISRKESTILFVGYQAEGTLGREILEGAKRVRIHGRMYDVNAKIDKINGLSAHADRDDLLRWASGFEPPPKGFFVTHGEESVALAFADALRERFPKSSIGVPEYCDEVQLM